MAEQREFSAVFASDGRGWNITVDGVGFRRVVGDDVDPMEVAHALIKEKYGELANYLVTLEQP